jgi:hypothetical protein
MEKTLPKARWHQLWIPTWLALPIAAAAVWLIIRLLSGGESLTIDSGLDEQRQQRLLWVEQAKESVRTQLKDAESAEFRNVAIRDYKGAPLVCGEVNAKNSFGGYSGYQQFVFAGSMGTFLAEHMKPGEMTKAWREFCAS